MAASGAPARQPRRGPAPIASFDHDGSDEVSKPSSPESKVAAARLPEIREDAGGARAPEPEGLAPPEPRARSHSTPAAGAAGALAAPAAPRIDISRASSSSHHDSRDSSPELALFAGGGGASLELAFREDGALDLRSSTEELAFLEPAPGEPAPALPPPRPASAAPPPAAPPTPAERRHSRKDSQCSEAALLAVSGRTSRLSSVGSQCSALSRVSRLSVVSGASRSPSPHRMLLETSFCGPKPIETDPEISAGALVDQILGLVNEAPPPPPTTPPSAPPAATPAAPLAAPVDARDRREVRTEVTLESARPVPAPAPTPTPAPAPAPPDPPSGATDADKNDKDTRNRTQVEERKARPRIRREPSEPEVYKSRNKSKDIIRIKLRPDDSCEEEDEPRGEEAARKPATLALGVAARPAPAAAPASPTPSRRRSPSPAGPLVSRKSSFCSLFKSRETIASPESPSEALRRKRSLTEGRARSKSRDRSATPTSGNKIRGSVLSLFRTTRRGTSPAPAPGSREGSPGVQGARPAPAAPPPDSRRADRLKYYEDAKDGVIHIPLRTPPDERAGAAPPAPRPASGGDPAPSAPSASPAPRPASAPQPRAAPDPEPRPRLPSKPIHRTVLPDGSIIIPLHSPTERPSDVEFTEITVAPDPVPVPAAKQPEETRANVRRSVTSPTCTSPAPAQAPDGDAGGAGAGAAPGGEARPRRKERLVFTTHVGSREQVFSTQFSITKTPSITSEISGSFPSFAEAELPAPAPLRDTHIASPAPPACAPAPAPAPASPGGESGGATPQEAPRDSSESEPSSEAAPSRAGNDVEKRVLVVAQESFEEDLPYVPTTLPQERSVALPMVPVRERGGVRVSGVQRPRAGAPPARAPPPPAPPAPLSADKLRIKLPRRPRPTPAPASTAPTPRAARPRTRSGGDSSGGEARANPEWIDFEEVPERRKQPKRIQTLPGGAGAGAGAPLLYSYVEPEQCRCECHAHARPASDDRLPLLTDDLRASVISTSSAECGDSEASPATPGPARGAPGS